MMIINWKAASLIAIASVGFATSASAAFIDTAPDGAKYSLGYINSGGGVYTFTFKADFTGVAASGAFGDYAYYLSFDGQPGGINYFTPGSILSQPAGQSNWSINTGQSNSNGCPSGVNADWKVCLSHADNSQAGLGSKIATNSVLTYVFTLNLVAGAPNFNLLWPYKFGTTTGGLDNQGNLIFGGYQISRNLTPYTCAQQPCSPPDINVPEPGSLALLGLGLLGLGIARRRVNG